MHGPANAEKKSLITLLIDAHPSVSHERQRRRARVLNTLALILLAILVPGLAIWVLTRGTPAPADRIALAIPLIVLGAYALGRSPRPQLGSLLIVFGLITVDFLLLLTLPIGTLFPTLILLFLPLLVLVAGLLGGVREVIIAALYMVAGIVVFWLVIPRFSFEQGLLGAAVAVLVAILAGASFYLRERDLRLIEKQSAELELYSRRLASQVDAQTQNIMAMAEIGQVMTGSRDLDTLLERVVNLIVERFDFYHAQVFLIDEAGKYAVLRQSTGEAGAAMLARGHQLEVGSRSVIGQVTATGKPVVALDTDSDPVHRRNELLPHTRSEMALPLRVSGRVIGALDIQSVNPSAFSETDVSIFQTMADQLAIAIQNALLFERARRDLEEIEQLNRQLTGDAWRRYVAGRSAVGYRASKGGVSPIPTAEAGADAGQRATVSLPLKVRGETIGMLDLTSQDGEPPDEQVQAMLEAVAERVALALDSSRLSDQSRRQAEREQILSRLSAELQATTDLNVILRIAAREASQALGTGRGFVHLVAEIKSD